MAKRRFHHHCLDDPKDIVDVAARDFIGDSKAEIVVRAVLHAKASKALGGSTASKRDALARAGLDLPVTTALSGIAPAQ